jgi:hypothetical protein
MAMCGARCAGLEPEFVLPARAVTGVGDLLLPYPPQGLDLPTRPRCSCRYRFDVPQILLAIPPVLTERATTNLCFGTRRPPRRGVVAANSLGGIGSKIWLSWSGRRRYSFDFKARPATRSLPPNPSLAMYANGWGCDQFGGAGLGIYPPLRSSLRADPLT